MSRAFAARFVSISIGPPTEPRPPRPEPGPLPPILAGAWAAWAEARREAVALAPPSAAETDGDHAGDPNRRRHRFVAAD